jgi:hypothetical protein
VGRRLEIRKGLEKDVRDRGIEEDEGIWVLQERSLRLVELEPPCTSLGDGCKASSSGSNAPSRDEKVAMMWWRAVSAALTKQIN